MHAGTPYRRRRGEAVIQFYPRSPGEFVNQYGNIDFDPDVRERESIYLTFPATRQGWKADWRKIRKFRRGTGPIHIPVIEDWE